MAVNCSCCKGEIDGHTVINCVHCSALVCEKCAKNNAMLCPYCNGELQLTD